MAYEVSIVREVSANPEKVWALITDLPRMGEWSPEATGGEWIEGASAAAVGAQFKGTNKTATHNWESIVTVDVCDAPRKFSFSLHAAGTHLCDWVYEIEPSTTGCQVTHAWVASPQWAGFEEAGIGEKISGVPKRAPHNLRSMEITLDNLIKAVK